MENTEDGREIPISLGRVPEIITDFLSGPGGRSLMVRGAPGTGKTTFALELLNEMKKHQKVCFISSRVEEEALKSHIPWLDFDILIKKDAYLNSGLRKQEKGQKLDRSELNKLENRIEEGDAYLEEPYDPESGTGMVESNSITFDFSMLLPEIDKLYDTIELALPTKTLVAIDSIEGLREKYGISSQRIIQALQKDIVENSQMNVIIIMERETSSNLDFLGDGVISLEMNEFEGRRFRVMKIEKLRGHPIHYPTIPFTLDGGHFNCFQRLESESSELFYKIEFGGILSNLLEEGTYNLIEIDPEVPVKVIHNLVYSILQENLAESRGTYGLASFRLFGDDIGGMLKSQELHDMATKYLRLLNPIPAYNVNLSSEFSNPIDGEVITEDLRWDSINELLPDSLEPYTFIIDIPLIESLYGNEALSDLESHIFTLLQHGGTAIGFIWTPDEVARADFGISNSMIRIRQVGRHTVFYGKKPYSQLNFLTYNKDKMKSSLELKIMI